MPKIKNNQAFG